MATNSDAYYIDSYNIITTGDEPDDYEPETPKVYEPIKTLDQVNDRLLNYMEQYNETVRGGKMDLVFFKVWYLP